MKRHETLVVEIEGNSQKWASLQIGRRVPRAFGELSLFGVSSNGLYLARLHIHQVCQGCRPSV
jgi:hypothetical protein